MEKLKIKSLSFSGNLIKSFLIVISVLSMMTACSNGSSKGNYVANPLMSFNYGGCPNCSSLTYPMVLTNFSMQSADGNVAFVNMQLFGQGAATLPMASGNYFKGYAGPVAAQGQLVVRVPQYDYLPGTYQPASSCVLMAGTYQLQAAALGQMDYQGVNIFLPALMVAGGAVELKIEAPSPMGLLDNGQRLWGRVSVVRVNGMLCSANFSGDFN